MPKKKAGKKNASKKTPARKNKAQTKAKADSKTKQTTLKEESKGRLVVSQDEKDEIDAVIDAFWSFIDLIKKSPRHLLFAGIVLALIGTSFSGWAQELIGQEKNGLWYAYTENDDELFLDPSGNFPNYGDGQEIRVEGTITGIEYFGSIEDYNANEDFYAPYPIRGDGAEESSIAPGDKFSKINAANIGDLFGSSGYGSQTNGSAINYANGEG